MKLTTMTAALVAATLSTAAMAQEATVATQDKAAIGAQAGTETTANLGQIVSSLKNGGEVSADWATELAALSTDADVEIVKLSDLKGQGAENSAALDQVIADAQVDLTAALPAIEANADLKAALEAESFTAQDVVAVMVDGDAKVTLIVDDAA